MHNVATGTARPSATGRESKGRKRRQKKKNYKTQQLICGLTKNIPSKYEHCSSNTAQRFTAIQDFQCLIPTTFEQQPPIL